MTIWYPDVSNYQGAMPLQPATVAVAAKATEGATYADPFYGHYKAEAARVGAVFFAYHLIHAGNAAAQARWCFAHTGAGVNVMIDCEATSGSNPSVADCVDFADEYRALGGLCTLVYLPRWYWQSLASPPLAPLRGALLELVSSDYTVYSDTGPGWAGYGGMDPVVWQYADNLDYSGRPVDFNAYRGTLDQLKALLGYSIQGVDMTDLQSNDVNLEAVEWRLDALVKGLSAVAAGPTKGEPNAVAAAFAAIEAKLAGLAAPSVDAGALASALAGDAAFVGAIAAAVVAQIGTDLKPAAG